MFCPGVVGMARSDAPDSANSQFFLMRATTASLDQKYTAFGRAIAGFDVIRAIKVGEPPTDPDRMTTVRILADIPVAEQPKIRVADTRGPGSSPPSTAPVSRRWSASAPVMSTFPSK